MNYLGHLYFSKNDTTLMLNNLYGDFVKGKNMDAYSEQQIEGILLHRKIDYFIDNHTKIMQLCQLLHNDLPKVYAVAIDIYFDHFLAKNWNKYHELELPFFLKQFYGSIDLVNTNYKPEFAHFIQKLIQYNWLSYYPTLFGLHKACVGVSKKISFPNELKNGLEIYLKHEKEIENVFEEFYLDAKKTFA